MENCPLCLLPIPAISHGRLYEDRKYRHLYFLHLLTGLYLLDRFHLFRVEVGSGAWPMETMVAF